MGGSRGGERFHANAPYDAALYSTVVGMEPLAIAALLLSLFARDAVHDIATAMDNTGARLGSQESGLADHQLAIFEAAIAHLPFDRGVLDSCFFYNEERHHFQARAYRAPTP
jgi:hypothetical protein